MRYLEHLARLGADFVHPGREIATELLVDALDLAPELEVLEVGCGTGGTLVRLAAERVGVTGIDSMEAMVAAARRRLRWLGLADRVRVVRVAPDRPWPLGDGSFDRICIESVLGFQDRRTLGHLLGEARRVLRSDGVLAANDAVWLPGVDPAAAARLNAECLEQFGLRQASELPWDVDDWCRVYEEHGFTVRSAARHEDLLRERFSRSGLRAASRWRGALSRLLSRLGSLRGRLSPRLAARRREFDRRVRRFEAAEKLVESRLFVVERRPG